MKPSELALDHAKAEMTAGRLVTEQDLLDRYEITQRSAESIIRFAQDATAAPMPVAAARKKDNPTMLPQRRKYVNPAEVAARKQFEQADRWSAQLPRMPEGR